jgi:hypothetical protein
MSENVPALLLMIISETSISLALAPEERPIAAARNERRNAWIPQLLCTSAFLPTFDDSVIQAQTPPGEGSIL